MRTENDAVQVFDTIMSIPGMNEPVRIDLKISRKNVLLLHHVIELGLLHNEGSPSVLWRTAAENIEELKQLSADCPARAGLKELSEKLAGFSQTKKTVRKVKKRADAKNRQRLFYCSADKKTP